MKKMLLLAICSLFIVIAATAQQNDTLVDTIRVVVENKKIKVTEYVSTPGKDACGVGLHSHPAHLTIFLTDGLMQLKMPDGKKQEFDLKAGAAFWTEPESHMVINSGKNAARVYLVELKKQ